MSIVIDELTKLAALRDAGVLTDAEFLAQKARLLDGSSGPTAAQAQTSLKPPLPQPFVAPSLLASTRGKVIAGTGMIAVALVAFVAVMYQPAQPLLPPQPLSTLSPSPAPGSVAGAPYAAPTSANPIAAAQAPGSSAVPAALAPGVGASASLQRTSAPAMDGNFLLGTWKLVSGPSGCNEMMTFTSNHTDQTLHGLTSGAAVSGYVVNGTSIIVGGVPGQSETFHYDVIDGNTVSQPGAIGTCTWRRG